MKGSIGRISEFDIHKDDWRLYVERLEQYFVVNEVKDTLQVPTLITVMGTESYELLVNLCTPEKPKDKGFAQIVEIMERHLQPKPSELAERYKFRRRMQKGGENILEYVAALKKMSKTCEFRGWLQESLRDQLVCGISSEVIRQRLFAESKLDFAKAYSLALTLEAAKKDAAIVEGRNRPSSAAELVECQAMVAGTSQMEKGAAGTWRGVSGATRVAVSRPTRTRSAHASPAPAPTLRGERTRREERGQRPHGCSVCGGALDSAGCRYSQYVCRVCNKPGHLRRVCSRVTEQFCVAVANDGDNQSSDSEQSEEFQIL